MDILAKALLENCRYVVKSFKGIKLVNAIKVSLLDVK